MERSNYQYSYKDNVTGPPPGRAGERVFTETEKESGYSMKCCGCIPLCFDKTGGPLFRSDNSVFTRPTGILRLLQLIPLIIAFVSVELALWCFSGLRAYTFFSTVTMCLIWFNLLFFLIYCCLCQWRFKCFDCYILDILYHLVAIILLLISSIFLALRVCSAGHIVGSTFGFIAALMYILSLLLLLREYQKFRQTKKQEKAWRDYNRNINPVRGDQPGSPSRYYPTPPPNMGRPVPGGGVFIPSPVAGGGPPPSQLYPDTVDYYNPGISPASQPHNFRQIPIQMENAAMQQQQQPFEYYRQPPRY